MTKFLLIRHGDTGLEGEDQEPSAPLSEPGRGQVTALVPIIKGQSVGQLLASPYARAWESAEIIAGALGLEVERDERLIEVDLWENPVDMRGDPEREQRLEKFLAEQSLVLSVLEEYRERFADQVIAIVGHGNWIRSAVGATLKAPVDSPVRLSVPLASVTVLEYDDRGFYRLRQFGQTPSEI